MSKREEEVLHYYSRSEHYGKTNFKAIRFMQGFLPHLTDVKAKKLITDFLKAKDKASHERWDGYNDQVKKWRQCNGFN